ncbi:hypothetical protein [Marinicauda pacifica]|uniref:hypothetical protein n=1 Tax=Marinicauda pacifica TaxID=1133559 RepID=UPI0035C82B3E
MSEQRYDFANATFFFFKTIGRRPGGFLAILIAQLIAYAVLVSILFAALAPALATIMRLAQSKSEPEFGEVLAIIGSFGLTGLLGTVLYIIVLVSVQAAWLRLMTRDEVKPVIPLRFGLDELRLLGVNIVLLAIAIVISLFGSVFFVLAGAGGAGLIAAGEGSVWSGLGAGLLGFLFSVAIGVALIWLAIKFAAAPAMTINERAFRVFESFSATRGIVGWMFLSYLVLLVVYLVLGVIVGIIQQIVLFAGFAGSFQAIEQMSTTGVKTAEQVFDMAGQLFSQPGIAASLILFLLLQFIMQVFMEGLWHGVGAYAAVRHSGGDTARTEDIGAPAGSVGDAPHEG